MQAASVGWQVEASAAAIVGAEAINVSYQTYPGWKEEKLGYTGDSSVQAASVDSHKEASAKAVAGADALLGQLELLLQTGSFADDGELRRAWQRFTEARAEG